MKGHMPDNAIVAVGEGQTNAEHIEAFPGSGNSYGMIYLSIGKKIVVNTTFIKSKKITA